ncbi:MAG: DUF2225 domain-containing protein [Chitinivibrionales bacterium]|nr:DUF2225 domain-containing protein [Chitinivibrionales bacterium]MBD3395752.1 DUF2225 domain-containing protein [Chitinivibrionales bacterium]
MTIDVIEVKRRLRALLNDNNLVSEYIRQYGPTIDIKNIKIIKEKKAKAARATESGEGNDPVFEIKLACPVCNQNEITCYELRAKSQQVLQNKFLVPRYQGAMGYRTVDYTMLGVAVCHRCLFASPDKKDFNRPNPSGAGEIKSQLTSNIIMTLQERIGERRALLKYVSDYASYFQRPRTEDAAIASYRLSMTRANVEAWYEQPYSFYKLGSYCLRIAKIITDGGGDNREVLREALAYFKEAFRTSNCPAEEIEMQVIYTIVALCMKLGDHRQANSYIGVFTNLKNARTAEMKEDPKLNTVTIEKWQDKARYLWEDRDREDLFDEE